jgi:hypothetical protein
MADLDARDMAALKLTVDHKGIVWELAGSRMPRSTGMDTATFMRDHSFSGDYNIRVVGTPTNAPFIVELFHRRVKSEFASLEVCSPLCCLDPTDREDPEVLLFSMRKFHRSPSLGGWHEFMLKDYPSYVLATYYFDTAAAMNMLPITRTGTYPADYPKQLLYHHPAWPYLTFIEGLGVDICSELIASIIDPRWYSDPAPDGTDGDRLEQFLGLYPGISKETESTRAKRYQMVLGCWKNSSGSVLKADGPRGFVWRVWASKGGGEKGDIAACKFFTNYLRLTWTMSLCTGPQAQHLFVPSYFFNNKDEIDAFTAHISRFNPQP